MDVVAQARHEEGRVVVFVLRVQVLGGGPRVEEPLRDKKVAF
jgi:hypothetical protein